MTAGNQILISSKNGKPLTLCLSASGGGHFRQLLDLKPFWTDYPHFLVTEPTALARSFEQKETIEYVPHFALGQARMGRGLALVGAAWASIWRSAAIVLRRRPDVVISTGAGSQTFLLVWARLAGARIILIDSFARFDRPSKFARFAGRLAHVRIAQSQASADKWPGAYAFDPLIIGPPSGAEKEHLLVATVGAVLPFDRLSQLVAAAKRDGDIPERVILQTGQGAAPISQADGLELVEELPFDELGALLRRARTVVCHGGTGSLITALSAGCKVIAVPRTVANGDAYDDHQREIVRMFEERGLIRSAVDEPSFRLALRQLSLLKPVTVTMDQSAMIGLIRQQLSLMFPAGRPDDRVSAR